MNLSVSQKEYVPAKMYELNKYLIDYIYLTGTTVFGNSITVTVKKGPGYETNAPSLVLRNGGLKLMSPNKTFDKYTRAINININGEKNLQFKEPMYLCGDTTATVTLQKPEKNPKAGLFNLQLDIPSTDSIIYHNYHIDLVMNNWDSYTSFDKHDFIVKSPELLAKLCVLQNAPPDSEDNPMSIFNKFLIESPLANLITTEDCTQIFNDDTCGPLNISNNPSFKRLCSCKKNNPDDIDEKHFLNEKRLNQALFQKYGDSIPVYCYNPFCRDGGYFKKEICPNICATNSTIKLLDDKQETVTLICKDDSITGDFDALKTADDEAKMEADKKQAAEVLAEEKKSKTLLIMQIKR